MLPPGCVSRNQEKNRTKPRCGCLQSRAADFIMELAGFDRRRGVLFVGGAFAPRLVLLALAVMNLSAFAAFGIDKRRAIRKQWRIPEARLLALAALGGGCGALAGMLAFRHKTKHLRFEILVPLFAAAQLVALCLWLLRL